MITGALSSQSEQYTGVPGATLTYDGAGVNINEKIRPYSSTPAALLVWRHKQQNLYGAYDLNFFYDFAVVQELKAGPINHKI